MVKDIELEKKIDKLAKEVEGLIALDRFMKNSSYFIEKFRGIKHES